MKEETSCVQRLNLCKLKTVLYSYNQDLFCYVGEGKDFKDINLIIILLCQTHIRWYFICLNHKPKCRNYCRVIDRTIWWRVLLLLTIKQHQASNRPNKMTTTNQLRTQDGPDRDKYAYICLYMQSKCKYSWVLNVVA